jgi:hypothetical protein
MKEVAAAPSEPRATGGRRAGRQEKKERSEGASSTAADPAAVGTGDAEGGRGRGEKLRWKN